MRKGKFSVWLKDDRVELCLRSWRNEFQMSGKRKFENHEFCVCIDGFPEGRCHKKECRHLAAQRGTQDRAIYSTEAHTHDFGLNTY